MVCVLNFSISQSLVAMPKSCCAVDCTSRHQKGSKISFYRIPSKSRYPERRRLWITALKRKNWVPGADDWVCSKHFVGGRCHNDSLSPAYVPKIFNFTRSPVKRKLQSDFASYERRAKRRLAFESEQLDQHGMTTTKVKKCDVEQALPAATFTNLPTVYSEELSQALDYDREVGNEKKCSVSCQSAMTAEDISDLEKDRERLMVENEKLLKEKNPLDTGSLSQSSFEDNDEKVRFYTGLPSYAVLMVLFEFLGLRIKPHHRHSLSLFHQFLVVLMKLRLGYPDQELGYRFGVHQTTISRIFVRWISTMFVLLKPLIVWPDREELRMTLPLEFRKHYPRCVCIIDCFEVFCERPTDLMARAQTYSHYKGHNTVKFLIAITPQGTISFISQSWGGRTSDKHLTEHSGLLNKLTPGDLVLADRGFTVDETVGMYCAELATPAFTKGKKQLSRREVDMSRKLARLRIHVERVIGMLRQKYSLLSSTLPINFLMTSDGDPQYALVDKVVTVCCALCNMCESVVPLT